LKKDVVVAGGLHASIKGQCIVSFAAVLLLRILLYPKINTSALGAFLPWAVYDAICSPSRRHMGVSVVDPNRGDVDKIISAVRESYAEARASKL